MSVQALLKEPFVHFCILGVGLFGLWSITDESADGSAPALEQVFVSSDVIDGAKLDFVEVQGRDPDDAELSVLIDERVTEEILYRAGRAAGLDKGDPIVRRRVVQKMQYLLEESADVSAPTDAEIDAWLAARGDAPPTSLAVSHVFFDSGRRTNAEDDAKLALDEVSGGADEPPGGDPTAFGSPLGLRPLDRYRRELGPSFADGVEALPVGEWTLVRSTYGWHVVRVDQRVEGADADDSSLREQATWALTRAAVDAAVAAEASELAAGFDVTVEGR